MSHKEKGDMVGKSEGITRAFFTERPEDSRTTGDWGLGIERHGRPWKPGGKGVS